MLFRLAIFAQHRRQNQWHSHDNTVAQNNFQLTGRGCFRFQKRRGSRTHIIHVRYAVWRGITDGRNKFVRQWRTTTARRTRVHSQKRRKKEKRGGGSRRCREWIGGDVSDENPGSVNFPVDGFPWRKFLDAGPQGIERKRNADPDRIPALFCRNPSPVPSACVELLLIKGIVERLVERPCCAPTMHVEIAFSGFARETALLGLEGVVLVCWMTAWRHRFFDVGGYIVFFQIFLVICFQIIEKFKRKIVTNNRSFNYLRNWVCLL